MLTVKVLGPGCANCKRLEQIAQQAVSQLGFEAQVVKVSDYGEILEHGVVTTPGLVVNDQVVCSGRVPSLAEVTSWLTTALASAA
jgi:small redox-active disulfide protein 2